MLSCYTPTRYLTVDRIKMYKIKIHYDKVHNFISLYGSHSTSVYSCTLNKSLPSMHVPIDHLTEQFNSGWVAADISPERSRL